MVLDMSYSGTPLYYTRFQQFPVARFHAKVLGKVRGIGQGSMLKFWARFHAKVLHGQGSRYWARFQHFPVTVLGRVLCLSQWTLLNQRQWWHASYVDVTTNLSPCPRSDVNSHLSPLSSTYWMNTKWTMTSRLSSRSGCNLQTVLCFAYSWNLCNLHVGNVPCI